MASHDMLSASNRWLVVAFSHDPPHATASMFPRSDTYRPSKNCGVATVSFYTLEEYDLTNLSDILIPDPADLLNVRGAL